ncbi:M48 family metalloprotease [Aminivibrio sp.]
MLLNRFLPLLSRPLPYEVKIIRDEMINAFSLPGGTIYFTTGIIDFLRTDGEIAAILAHELIHADKGHVMIQTARASKISLAGLLLLVASQGSVGPMILTNLAQIAVTNSYSKDLEREADREGFRILEGAGFPPAAMITALEAMAYDQLKHPYFDPGVFMTHPELSERIAYILEIARERGFPLHRKNALHLLRPSVEEEGERLVLRLDGNPVWSLPRGGENERLLKEISAKIEAHLQMETPPFEIQVLSLGGGKALRLGPALILSEPLPSGAEPLESFRNALVHSLGKARDTHPGAHYLR